MHACRRMVLAVLSVGLAASACSLPDLAEERAAPLAQTSFLYAADGSLITELHAGEDRVILGFGAMPQNIRDAVVAIEDQRFYFHHGVDARALLRAAYIDVTTGRIAEGGSTITQQLVKNLYVGNALTFTRKIDEASLAWQLEDRLTKDQILTKYLNTVYFGEGAYGVQAAARRFFGEDAADLNVRQSAVLAGAIAAPTDFDPFQHPKRARSRRDEVLNAMLSQGMISQATHDRASADPIKLSPGILEEQYPDPYFVDYFKEWFLSNPRFGETRLERNDLLFSGGLRITTTLDPQAQAYALRAVNGVLAYKNDPVGALTAIDPRTGYVRAMVGGRSYWDDTSDIGRVNLATGGSTGRQAGSAFKPFALVAALENGISPQTVYAAPSSIEIPLDNGKVWSVSNAEGGGYGSLTLEQATVNSVNTVYAQLIRDVGAQNVVDVAKRMGIRCCKRATEPRTNLLPYLSAVLGANEVNPTEMASAYGTLATGGKHVQPTPVISILDARGNSIYEANSQAQRVLDPQVAAATNDILREVVLFGTGTNANIGRPQIGKTGTGQEYRDAWFVGAVPQLSVAVWVGFPQGQISMQPPRTRITVFGGTWPAQIWRLFMSNVTRGMPVKDFPGPNVHYVTVTVDTSQSPMCLPNPYTLPQNVDTLQFIEGTEPTKVCKEPTSAQRVTVPSVIGLSQGGAESLLQGAGFYVKVKVASSTQPPGTVIAQSPSAGTQAYQTSTVTITVSKDTTST